MEEETRRVKQENSLRKNLKKIGRDYDRLSPKDKNTLLTIEEAIEDIFEIENTAREMLIRNTVSLQGVSKKTGIARQTLYNNPILKEYIEVREKEFNGIDASNVSKTKDEEIKRLKEEIKLFHLRDVEYEEIKRKNKELKKALKDEKAALDKLKKEKANTYRINLN